jgi:hypothetical protein
MPPVMFSVVTKYHKGRHSLFLYNLEIFCAFTQDILRSLIEYYIGKDGIAYADKLLEEKSHTYEGDRWAPIYVELPIGKECESRDYSVTIKVYEAPLTQGEKLILKKEIKVVVDEYGFSDDITDQFKLDIWQQPSNLARTFKVPMWGNEHFDLIDEMASKLAELGQKTVTVIASEIPWKGWFNYIVKDYPANLYEYSMIRVSKDQKIKCDFKILDQYLETFAKHGIDQEIEIFGLLGVWQLPFFPQVKMSDYPEALVIRYFDENSKHFEFIQSKEDLDEYFRQIFAHLKALGVWDKVRIISDEPKINEITQFKDALTKIKAIEPTIKIKVAFDKEDVLNSLLPEIDFPATSFFCTTQNSVSLQENYSGRMQYYICNYPDKPNTFLHSPLLETRLQGVLAHYLKTDGFLRWAFNCWPINAREDIRYNVGALPIGDNCIVYPGNAKNILLSLRYKQIRRGIEDFYLIKQASKKDSKLVQKILDDFIGNSDPKSWMIDSHHIDEKLFGQTTEEFETLRRNLVGIIN